MSPTKSLSTKNTKQDILSAYEELLQQVSQGDKTTLPSDKIAQKSDQLGQVQSQLHAQVAQLQSTLSLSVDEILEKLQQGTKTLETLLEAQAAIQENTKTEQSRIKKLRDQEEEEYRYEFSKRKQRQEAELQESLAVAQKKLVEREAKIKETEDELSELRKMRDQWDAKMQKTVDEAVTAAVKDVNQLHSHELALLKGENQAAQSLLKQQVEYLQKQIGIQGEEIKRLQKESAQASEYVTRIAERAVEKPATMMSAPGQSKI